MVVIAPQLYLNIKVITMYKIIKTIKNFYNHNLKTKLIIESLIGQLKEYEITIVDYKIDIIGVQDN